MAPSDTKYDIAIIGGGINGAGIARDAAGRGYRVLLAEKGDLAQGTSSGSTKLIHGGLRYLEHYQFRLVREALQERDVLLRSAPHIIWPLRFVLPVDRAMRPAWLIRAGLFLYDHIGGRQRLGGTRRLDLTRDPAGAPLKQGPATAFEYADCWVDDARLVVLNAVDAAARGAVVQTRTRVVRAAPETGGAGQWVLTLEDVSSGAERHVSARVLVNAGGPWLDAVARDVVGDNNAARLRLVRGSHIVVPRLFDHDKSYTFQNADGRVVFAIPYETHFTLLGTTEVDTQDDPGAAQMSADERDYLLGVANSRFRRQLTATDIVWSYAAVRPLVDGGGGNARDESRDYKIDVSRHGDAMLVAIAGGKITTYRRLAENVIGLIDKALGRHTEAWTGSAALPGGDFDPDDVQGEIRRLSSAYPFLAPDTCRRLVRTYGTLASDMLGDARCLEDLGEAFGGGLTAREVCYCVEREWARDVEDIVWRRTKLGLVLTSDQHRRLGDFLGDRVHSKT